MSATVHGRIPVKLGRPCSPFLAPSIHRDRAHPLIPFVDFSSQQNPDAINSRPRRSPSLQISTAPSRETSSHHAVVTIGIPVSRRVRGSNLRFRGFTRSSFPYAPASQRHRSAISGEIPVRKP